jgi:hypothetical protein
MCQKFSFCFNVPLDLISMKTISPFFILIIFFPILLVAQNPDWTGKLVLKHPSGAKDTVWFGLSEQGGAGYQQGLDSLDTNLNHPISILSYDYLVKQQFSTPFCGNLRRNVQEFKHGKNEFVFYITSDTFPPEYSPAPVEFLWDTLDFIYSGSDYEIHVVSATSYGGYFKAIDLTHLDLYYYNEMINNSTAILIYEETPFGWLCDSEKKIMAIKLDVWINTSIGLRKDKENKMLSIYPNPNEGKFYLDLETFSGTISIYDNFGNSFHQEDIEHFNGRKKITMENALPGLYYVRIYNSISKTNFYGKFITKP